MKNRKTIIIVIVIVLFLIIVSIATFLIYKNNKKKKELKKQELAQQMLLLQQQASSSTTPSQKQNLVAQLASLAQQIKDLSEPNEVITQINDQVAPIEFPLKKGSKGQYVSNLQNGLNSKCSANLVPDGAFGNLTQNALVKCFGPTQVDFALYNKIIS